MASVAKTTNGSTEEETVVKEIGALSLHTPAPASPVATAPSTGAGAGAGAGSDSGTSDDADHVKLAMPMVASRSDEDIVRLRNVHKTYLLGIEGVPALRGVTMNIKRGEFVMIIGKSGSGKTTMLNILGTIDVPTRGDLHLCGSHITPKTTDFELAHTRLSSLGFVFQTFNLLSGMTAVENVEMPMVLAGIGSSARRKRAVQLLERFGMGPRVNHKPAQLSGGEQQRVTIARALANHPELLLLDEPTGDLDTVNSDIVMRILTDLNAIEGVTLVMVTHDVGLRNYAHRVVHMLDGKIQRTQRVSEGARREALRELQERTSKAIGATTVVEAQKSALSEAMKNTRVRKPGFYSRIAATA